VQVTVRSTQGTAEIVVRDTGVGMAAQDLKRVFEPLVQVASAQSRSHGGLGLGLALVKGLAEAHGVQRRCGARAPVAASSSW